MLEMNGNKINKQKLVSCYLKKKGIDFSERGIYDNMSDEELEEMITSEFDVKGDVNWKSLQKAKKIDSPETEHDIQVKVCKYCKDNRIGHVAIPNGIINKFDVKYLSYLRAEGAFKNGMFDMVIMKEGRVGFLEVKTPKGKPSEYQLKWLKWFKDNNFNASICYGYDECISFIDNL